jgi:hypothetical protein
MPHPAHSGPAIAALVAGHPGDLPARRGHGFTQTSGIAAPLVFGTRPPATYTVVRSVCRDTRGLNPKENRVRQDREDQVDRVILVALIGAIGAVAAAVIPPLLAPHEVPHQGAPLAYHGMATLSNGNPEIDLDASPDGTGGDHIPDLIHEPTALTTSPSSLIVLLDRAQQPTPESCRSALATHGTHGISVSQLETGRSLCIRTSGGRLGAVTLDLVNKYLVNKYKESTRLGRVTLSYRIWDVPAN